MLWLTCEWLGCHPLRPCFPCLREALHSLGLLRSQVMRLLAVRCLVKEFPRAAGTHAYKFPVTVRHAGAAFVLLTELACLAFRAAEVGNKAADFRRHDALAFELGGMPSSREFEPRRHFSAVTAYFREAHVIHEHDDGVRLAAEAISRVSIKNQTAIGRRSFIGGGYRT